MSAAISSKAIRDTRGYLAHGGAVGVVPHDFVELGKDAGVVACSAWT